MVSGMLELLRKSKELRWKPAEACLCTLPHGGSGSSFRKFLRPFLPGTPPSEHIPKALNAATMAFGQPAATALTECTNPY